MLFEIKVQAKSKKKVKSSYNRSNEFHDMNIYVTRIIMEENKKIQKQKQQL